MQLSRSFRLTLCVLTAALVTVMCSSTYITPDSVAATQAALAAINARAATLTALALPSEGPTDRATSTQSVVQTATAAGPATEAAPFVYTAQSGDTLKALTVRFGVDIIDIASPQDISTGLIGAGQILSIPNVVGATLPDEHLIPDSEVVYSPSAIGFNTASFAGPFGGHLMTYRQYLPSDWYTGTAIIERVALEHSLNPRLLLSILQQQSNWVLGAPKDGVTDDYPIGFVDPSESGLYRQLTEVAKALSIGYYGWREGVLTELTFRDGSTHRIAPDQNAGTVAIQYLFAQLYDYENWLDVMDPNVGFPFTHGAMFPDPWARAAEVEPLFPAVLEQPHMSLPFFSNQIWYFTSGPHGAYEPEGAQAALDFAPSSSLPGCTESEAWITAAESGLVVRSQRGVLLVDLDGDGNEQTGWVILYLHVTNKEHLSVGDWVNRGDKLGNPSCEGGVSTATHLHMARKYNGEWISATGPIPFELSGWVAQEGGTANLHPGSLIRGDAAVVACTCSGQQTIIARSENDPY